MISSWVSFRPYLQILDKAGITCQGQMVWPFSLPLMVQNFFLHKLENLFHTTISSLAQCLQAMLKAN